MSRVARAVLIAWVAVVPAGCAQQALRCEGALEPINPSTAASGARAEKAGDVRGRAPRAPARLAEGRP